MNKWLKIAGISLLSSVVVLAGCNMQSKNENKTQAQAQVQQTT
jgi:hypothetical protein